MRTDQVHPLHAARQVEDRDDVVHLFWSGPAAPATGEVGTALCGKRARRKIGDHPPAGGWPADHCRSCIRVLDATRN